MLNSSRGKNRARPVRTRIAKILCEVAESDPVDWNREYLNPAYAQISDNLLVPPIMIRKGETWQENCYAQNTRVTPIISIDE